MEMFSSSLRVRDTTALSRRTICLGVFYFRLELELFESQGFETDGHEVNGYLMIWLKKTGLFDDLSAQERNYLSVPFKGWTEDDLTRLVWHVERFGMLLWILSQLDDLPSVDTSLALARRNIADLTPLFQDPERFLEDVQVRDVHEIARMADLLTTYAYRLSIRPGELHMPSADGTIRDTIAREAEALHKIGSIEKVIDHDLPAFGKAVGALSPDELEFLRYIISHRLGALSWATHQIEDWSVIGPK